MDQSTEDIHGTDLAPGFCFASMEQWIGKHMPVDEQAAGLRIDPTSLLHKTFDIPARLQPKAQPVLQHLLWVNCLPERSIHVPFCKQDRVGLCKNSFELILPLVI